MAIRRSHRMQAQTTEVDVSKDRDTGNAYWGVGRPITIIFLVALAANVALYTLGTIDRVASLIVVISLVVVRFLLFRWVKR